MKKGLLLILWSSLALSGMNDQAKHEGWTFHFNEKSTRYATGFKKSTLPKSLTYSDLSLHDVEIPTQYDLRGKLSQIENQGNCGSCWAFSLTATLLDAWVLASHDPGRLSQQYLVDCAKNEYGCNGGDFEAANYFIEPKGAPLLSDYPYTARNGRCKTNMKPAAGILEWHYVGASGRTPSVQEIQKAILLYGPVSVTVGADNTFSSYESGIYNACTNASTNHMVNLVGWNDTEKYWIMRNSWGKNWGEDGYMRIKYIGKSGRLCNRIAEEAAYVKIDATPVPPPEVKDFTVDGKTITVKGTLKEAATYKVEDAKKAAQDLVESLDKK